MEEDSSPISHSLFSTLITFYIIILLYFPKHFTQIALSPVLILTLTLLITLLRLGSTQNFKNKLNSIKTEQAQQNYEDNDSNFASIENHSNPKTETRQNPLCFSLNSTETEQIHKNPVLNDPNFASIETNLNRDMEMEQNSLFFAMAGDPLEVVFEEDEIKSKINSTDTEQTHQNSASRDHNSSPIITDSDPKTGTLQNLPFYSFERKINSAETEQTHQNSESEALNFASPDTNCYLKRQSEPNPLFYSFIDVKAPLEVIYEEDDELNEEIERFRYPLSYWYFSENDSDESSSEENFQANDLCFEWEKEEEIEGLIEIELSGKIKNESFQGEEDNLIEIDIFSSPAMISL